MKRSIEWLFKKVMKERSILHCRDLHSLNIFMKLTTKPIELPRRHRFAYT